MHISSGFDAFLVIYSATRKYTESIPDGYLLNAKVNRSVCVGFNIYIKEANFFYIYTYMGSTHKRKDPNYKYL